MPKTHDPLTKLDAAHSWTLQRISATTFPQDVVMTLRRGGQVLREAEIAAVTGMVRRGCLYRCRIAKGRYFFGSTPAEAIEAAVAALPKRGRKR